MKSYSFKVCSKGLASFEVMRRDKLSPKLTSRRLFLTPGERQKAPLNARVNHYIISQKWSSKCFLQTLLYLFLFVGRFHQASAANPSPSPRHMIRFLHRHITSYTYVYSVLPAWKQTTKQSYHDVRNSTAVSFPRHSFEKFRLHLGETKVY